MTAIIIQARMSSTRLPGKVLLPLIDNISILQVCVDRLLKTKLPKYVIISTTTNLNDDKIEEFYKHIYGCNKKVKLFRGSENDVLDRFYRTALEFDLDLIIRVTSDCPAIDPNIIDQFIKYFIYGDFDYVSNAIDRSYPRGLDVEIFNFSSLKKAFDNANETYQREHVTPYIYSNNEMFKISSYQCNLGNYSKYRITVDTLEDYENAKKIFELLSKKHNYTDFRLVDLINILDNYHDINDILDVDKQTTFNSDNYYQQSLSKKK